MTLQAWTILGAVSFLVLASIAFLWWRMPLYRWYCRRCNKVVSLGRFHPAKCSCGTSSLVAYFCRSCGGWNTSPTSQQHYRQWHCCDCSSKAVALGVEYHLVSAYWKWCNRAA